jgi:hypothetical protein
MNERIYLLAEQAGAYCEVLRGGDYKPPVLDSMNLEKFAELIIRECAGVVAEHFDSSEPWITPKTILYHFGIKHNGDDE